jgi:hypothetical protein
MLYLAKFAGVAILVWFYLTAKEKGQPTLQWALIGFIGFWLTWWLVKLSILHPLGDMLAKSPTSLFLVTQIPAIAGIIVCFFIRKKLIANAAKETASGSDHG